MRAKTISIKVALPAAVAITLFSAFGSVQDATAFQALGGASTGETCAFSTQMQKPTFRMRYMQKVANYKDGVTAPKLATVEEMYSNVQEVSLFSDESGAEVLTNAVGVDALSLDCLGCHDGSGASNITINLRNDPYKRLRAGQVKPASDHPIGMDYASYVARGDDYKPIFGRGNMVLVDGKVGCLTCHDPLNNEKGHLVMSDRNSGLCLSCHGK